MNTFEEIEHKYLIRFSKLNFKQPLAFTNYAKFSVSSLRRQLSETILSEIEKSISIILISKARMEGKLLFTDNELIQELLDPRRSNPKIMHTFILPSKVLGEKV